MVVQRPLRTGRGRAFLPALGTAARQAHASGGTASSSTAATARSAAPGSRPAGGKAHRWQAAGSWSGAGLKSEFRVLSLTFWELASAKGASRPGRVLRCLSGCSFGFRIEKKQHAPSPRAHPAHRRIPSTERRFRECLCPRALARWPPSLLSRPPRVSFVRRAPFCICIHLTRARNQQPQHRTTTPRPPHCAAQAPCSVPIAPRFPVSLLECHFDLPPRHGLRPARPSALEPPHVCQLIRRPRIARAHPRCLLRRACSLFF